MSARELIPFQFEGRDIRVVHVDGEPHFVGKDVCDALAHSNASKAMGDHCKGITKRYPLLTMGGMQELRVLTEADVLRLIVSSTLPAAEAFERWVFEEVLPSIRKTGGYSLPAADPFASLPPEQRALIAAMVDNANIKARQDAQAKEMAVQAEVQAVHAAALTTVEHRVDEIAAGQVLLTRPSAAESIVHVRKRIGELYGLPARIVDEVMRQSPYALKPVMVKNAHEDAQGGSYACFWIKDVSAVFARFVGECKRVTATQATHPYIEGRFKLTAPAARGPGGQLPLLGS